jgi:hypothetical protein
MPGKYTYDHARSIKRYTNDQLIATAPEQNRNQHHHEYKKQVPPGRFAAPYARTRTNKGHGKTNRRRQKHNPRQHGKIQRPCPRRKKRPYHIPGKRPSQPCQPGKACRLLPILTHAPTLPCNNLISSQKSKNLNSANTELIFPQKIKTIFALITKRIC